MWILISYQIYHEGIKNITQVIVKLRAQEGKVVRQFSIKI